MFGIFTSIPTFTSQLAFLMVFDVLTLILSINDVFSFHHMPQVSKRDFIKTSNTYVTVELVCVVYFNS